MLAKCASTSHQADIERFVGLAVTIKTSPLYHPRKSLSAGVHFLSKCFLRRLLLLSRLLALSLSPATLFIAIQMFFDSQGVVCDSKEIFFSREKRIWKEYIEFCSIIRSFRDRDREWNFSFEVENDLHSINYVDLASNRLANNSTCSDLS